MKKLLFLLSIAILCSVSLSAQKKSTPKSKIYKSSTGMFYDVADCYYNPLNYTEEELRNAEILSYGTTTSSMNNGVQFDASGLTDEQYQEKLKNYFTNCKLPKGTYWENLRTEGLKKLEYEYDILQLNGKAMKDPSVLKNGKYSQYCTKYIKALNGTDDQLMIAWKELATEQSKKNVDPERIMKEFQTHANSSDWKKSARQYILDYGWWNCMADAAYNKAFYNIDQNTVYTNFRKMFVKIIEPEI